MRRSLKIMAALLVLTILGVSQAQAICRNARIVSSAFPRGTVSYIQTPGVIPTPTSSSVTDDFEGFFWAIGDGHPSHLQGQDNGAFIAGGESGWVLRPPGYPAAIHTAWSANILIDGCADRVLPASQARCTAVLLSDQVAGDGFFALVTAASIKGNYSLVQPANAPIILSPITKPQVTAVTASGVDETMATANVLPPPGGQYLHSGCSSNLITGYRLYVTSVARGASAPTNLRRLQQGSEWELADGGELSTGQPLTLGSSSIVTRECSSTEDFYLAASLVFESGFETAHVSTPAGPFLCGGGQ